MTYEAIVSEVLDRLNLTSEDARVRVGLRVNSYYKRVTSGIGLVTSRRVHSEFTLDPTDPGSVLPDYTFEEVDKILRITLLPDAGRIKLLRELTYDEVTNIQTISRTPHSWAVKRVGAHEVTVTFDAFPETDTFDLKVEAYQVFDYLEDDDEPAFPEDYHDVLVYGALAEEYLKMEKPQLAGEAKTEYERRLSDLKFFLIKSSYLDFYQGKTKPTFQDGWATRSGIWTY